MRSAPISRTCLPACQAHRAGDGGFVLDGYPRTLAQAQQLDRTSAAPDVVLHLVVPRDRLRRRLLGRGRPDDTADVIDHRLECTRT